MLAMNRVSEMFDIFVAWVRLIASILWETVRHQPGGVFLGVVGFDLDRLKVDGFAKIPPMPAVAYRAGC